MAGTSQIVMDASVILKWFIPEECDEDADGVKDRFASGELDILVPELLYHEVTNVLRYKPGYSVQDLEQCAQSLYGMQLNTIHWDNDLDKSAINLAFKYGLTIYDSAYLAITEMLDCRFVTCDDKMITK